MTTPAKAVAERRPLSRPIRARAGGSVPPGTCPVCAATLTRGERSRHIRTEHPSYWRTLLVRVVSPWAFLAIMFGLAAGRAPGWTFIAVLVGFAGASLWARHRSNVERSQRGLGVSAGQWMRGAGLGLMLMSVAFALAGVILSLSR